MLNTEKYCEPFNTSPTSVTLSPQFSKTRKEGHITVHYGKDRGTGFFICIMDDRLRAGVSVHDIPEQDLDSEVLDIISGMPEGESGSFLNAHTAMIGFGHKVNIPTIKFLWKRFDASDEDMKIFATGHEGVM